MRLPFKQDVSQNLRNYLIFKKTQEVDAVEFQSLVLRTDNLTVMHQPSNTIHYPDFQISLGDIFLIKGPSGSGKSSLIKLLIGYHSPSSGFIEYFNFSSLKDLQSDISYQSQFPSILPLSLKSNITVMDHYTDEEIEYFVELFKLNPILHRFKNDNLQVNQLSGGEKQRIGLARALISSKHLVVLDEPTNNLDYASKLTLKSFLTSKKRHQTFIIISHDTFFDQLYTNFIDLSHSNDLTQPVLA